MLKKLSLLLGMVVMLFGCAGVNPKDYSDEKPKLDIRKYFNGKVEAWGTFSDWKGKVIKRFTCEMNGKFSGNKGTLEEKFIYTDGTVQNRKWEITFTDDNHFTATAGDVIGTGTGEQYGNTVRMSYTLAVPVDGKTYNFAMDDWLFYLGGDLMMNKAHMSKFGIKVGEVNVSFKKK
ncbi:MAG: DUF3833 domain-containing protein [Proteobacteria bacterium]|nr:DUF3833 domain-containing protein [Pseudomonadota bacterium]